MFNRKCVWHLCQLSVVLTAGIFSTDSRAGLDLASLRQDIFNIPHAIRGSDYHGYGTAEEVKVRLGKYLFFDKILSGNSNISCATCHHAMTDTGDGLSLSIGEGGKGLGVTRDAGSGVDAVYQRVPRNSPPIYNLGAVQMTRLFHDGRVEVDDSKASGFNTPAGDDLPLGLDNVLAAQAMFPVTSSVEMAGQAGENTIADAVDSGNLAGPGGVWDQLAQRLQSIPEYVQMFAEAYGDISDASDITFVHAANAIAAFEASAWRSDQSPFDRYLRGDKTAMSLSAYVGMYLFYGKAGCSECHSGAFQTDMEFHAIAMPQIGPGKGDNSPGYEDGREDFGREKVTGDYRDRFLFRTPPLRNVALTAPYGHGGAYNTLDAVVRHHLDPVNALKSYNQSQAVLPSSPYLDELDFVVMNDPDRVQSIADKNELDPMHLSDREVKHLIDFLHALTDTSSLDLRSDTPRKVPSGLPVYD